MNIEKAQVIAYLQRNWFKIGIAALLIFIAFKKDLSFKLNLNTPVQMEEQPLPPPSRKQAVQSERYTELSPEETAESSATETERFDFTAAARPRRPLSALRRLQQVDEARIKQYIKRFDRVALSEEKKFGIPAAITLGNAILNSQAGTAPWAEEGRNNHFLLPCTEDWKGDSKSYDGRCLRMYENAWTSFRDHSFFVTTGPYSSLQQLGADNVRGWAQALQQKAFSREEDYAQQLLKVIERYGLDQL